MPQILEKLIPRVPEQLLAMGFIEEDFMPLIQVIEERLQTRQNGAQWQFQKLTELRQDMPKREALVAMLRQYQRNSAANIPVAQWQ